MAYPYTRLRRMRRDDFSRRLMRELVPTVHRDGTWVINWPNSDTAKCNEWKNGFHGAEHALVMFLFSHWMENTPAPLYFAFPADQIEALASQYLGSDRAPSVSMITGA